MSQHDFDFGFGPGRHLKGRGWFGILALALFVAGGLIIAIVTGPSAARGVTSAASWAYDLVFFRQGASRSQSPAMIEP